MDIRVFNCDYNIGKTIFVFMTRGSYIGILKKIDIPRNCIMIDDRFFNNRIIDMSKVESICFETDKKEIK